MLQNISRDIVAPESALEYERLQEALKRTERAEVRYRVIHPELGQRWLLTRVEPATLASGKKTASVVTLDITDQQVSQRRSEQLLREMTTILESTTAGIAYLRGGALVRCNRRFEAMLQLPPSAVAGSSLAELLSRHPDAESAAAEIREALIEGSIYETEFAFDGADAASSSGDLDDGSGVSRPAALVLLGLPCWRRDRLRRSDRRSSDVTRLVAAAPARGARARARLLAEQTRSILDWCSSASSPSAAVASSG
jgi:PAS domain-containing protein